MREQRRRRILEIRQTIVALTLCAFIIAFSTIYIQMAMGKDPALGGSATAQIASASTEDGSTKASSAVAATPGAVATAQPTPDPTVAATQSFQPAPVTSGQS